MIRLGETQPESLETFQSIQQYLNLNNFVDYLLLNFYSGNTDWDNGNWRAGRRREPGAGCIFFAWDSERAIGDSAQSSLATATDVTNRNVAGEFVYTLNGADPRMPGGDVHPRAKREDSVSLLESTTGKARLLIDGEWGALTEADYTMEAAGAFELAQARASGDPRGILVYFTRPPEPSDALNPAHYRLLGQPTAVLEAELFNPQTVLLRVGEFDMTPMTLEVRNLRESGADPGSAAPGFQADVRLKSVESFNYGPLSWIEQPRSITVFEGTDARFAAMAEGSAEEAIQYRWMREGVILENEAEAAHELKGVRAEDSGSRWQAAAFNDNGAFQPILSDEAMLTVIADRFGPAADAIEGWSVLNRVDIRFNEAIDPATVAAASNYILEGVLVHQAVWDAEREIVSLFTGPLESGMRYSLGIAGVMEGDDSDGLNGTLSLYLNGDLAGQQSGVGQIYNHSGDVRAGYGDVRLHNNATGAVDYFHGVLDELALYSHSLAAERIRAHYLAGVQTEGGSPGPIAPYLQIGFAGADILIHFTGRLEFSAALNGPWEPFSAQSPVVITMEDPIARRFWRAVRE